MDPLHEYGLNTTRRSLLTNSARAVGAAALATLLGEDAQAAPKASVDSEGTPGVPGLPHFAAKAKRVIYLFFSGGPSHIDMYDYKPAIRKVPWSGTAGLDSQRPANHRHDIRAKVVSLRCTDVQVSKVWSAWNLRQ